MARRRTFLLALLVVTAFLFGGFCHLRMLRLKEEAQIARDNLIGAQAALAEIRRWKASPGRAAAVAMEAPQLSATLRQAALAAGLPDAPGSEPGSATRLAGTDYSELPVFLRFEPLTMKQLTSFLVSLSRIDASARATVIELTPPDPTTRGAASAAPGEEVWSAGVEVDYLTYSPQKSSK
ncbi:MAG: hypothetical protein JWN40_5873 [Phycisphaerales bacterium]|nr:hypothetical protein [Phycisphaerales bacterium]